MRRELLLMEMKLNLIKKQTNKQTNTPPPQQKSLHERACTEIMRSLTPAPEEREGEEEKHLKGGIWLTYLHHYVQPPPPFI